MKDYRRIASMMLAVLISISMLPAETFAADKTASDSSAASAAAADTADSKETGGDSDTAAADASGKETAGNSDASSDIESAGTETVKKKKVKTKTEFKWYHHQLKFKTFKVWTKNKLDADSEPLALTVRRRGAIRKLTWKLPRKKKSVDGFIVLRKRSNKDQYVQIAVVGPKKKSYTDKKAKNNRSYDYTVVGYKETEYGIRISPCSGEGRAPGRAYQNPSKYVQISDKISKHGLGYYTSPVLVSKKSTKKDHIEALIRTAYKYKGDPYVVCRSGAPGQGLDCSGLVMQACYGAGVDLWPVNPWRHRLTQYEYESRNIASMSTLKTVGYRYRKRGDLIFFCNSRGIIIHVAIYLGNDQIIHSTSVGNHVVVTGMGGGAYGRPCRVKRIFN